MCFHKSNVSIFIEHVSCFARGCFNGMYVTTCHSINIENSLLRYKHRAVCVFSDFVIVLTVLAALWAKEIRYS